MKCLSIFNSTPDLSYLWMDKPFKQHLIKLGKWGISFLVLHLKLFKFENYFFCSFRAYLFRSSDSHPLSKKKSLYLFQSSQTVTIFTIKHWHQLQLVCHTQNISNDRLMKIISEAKAIQTAILCLFLFVRMPIFLDDRQMTEINRPWMKK